MPVKCLAAEIYAPKFVIEMEESTTTPDLVVRRQSEIEDASWQGKLQSPSVWKVGR